MSEFNNLLLRRQLPVMVGTNPVYDAKYCADVVLAYPPNGVRRGGIISDFNLLCLGGETGTQFFVELEAFRNQNDQLRDALPRSVILREFYSVDDFRAKAKPIMNSAKFVPSEKFKRFMSGDFRSKRFKFAKQFPEGATFDLIATDGQHLLAKVNGEYAFLPLPYCDKTCWKFQEKNTRTDEENQKAMTRAITNACKTFSKKFIEQFPMKVSYSPCFGDFAKLKGTKKGRPVAQSSSITRA